MCEYPHPVFAPVVLYLKSESSSAGSGAQSWEVPSPPPVLRAAPGLGRPLPPWEAASLPRRPAKGLRAAVTSLTLVSPGPSQMSWRPQYRSSKFRNVYGKVANREHCFDGIPITKNVHDNHFCAVNARFLAIVTESAGGGSFLVIPLEQVGARLQPGAEGSPSGHCWAAAPICLCTPPLPSPHNHLLLPHHVPRVCAFPVFLRFTEQLQAGISET